MRSLDAPTVWNPSSYPKPARLSFFGKSGYVNTFLRGLPATAATYYYSRGFFGFSTTAGLIFTVDGRTIMNFLAGGDSSST